MRRTVLTVVGALVFAGVAGAVTAVILVAGPWTDTEQTTGNVVAQGDPKFLYICEPTGAGSEPCPGDDSAEDEIIFEVLDEDLTPAGAAATWEIRLRNISTGGWDVFLADAVFTETADPDADCADLPVVSYVVFQDGSDDHGWHGTGNDPIPGAMAFPPAGSFPGHGQGPHSHSLRIIHVAPAGQEDVQIFVSLPASMQAECRLNAWDIDIDWTVQPH